MDKIPSAFPTVGDHLSHWSLPMLDGGAFDSESLRGKRVLLYMWGSW